MQKAQYSLREFEQVEVIFEELQRNDHYHGVKDMDIHSNVLQAKECFFAHRVFLIDKYRRKSYCIIGIYYKFNVQKGSHLGSAEALGGR